MFKKILLGLAVIVAGFFVFVAFQPDQFSVSRSAQIDAPPAEVFAYLDDPRAFNEWSPWAKMDPDAVYTFEGPERGQGAVVKWRGDKSGEGVSTIVEHVPGEHIKTRLDFIKPFEATSYAVYDLEERDGGTYIAWTMEGENDFLGKTMWLLFCRHMMGSQFEEGLQNLKTLVENQ